MQELYLLLLMLYETLPGTADSLFLVQICQSDFLFELLIQNSRSNFLFEFVILVSCRQPFCSDPFCYHG